MAQIVEPLVCTGATGFVGSEVLRQAVAQGLHPLGLGRGAAGAVHGSDYRAVDILDASALREVLDGSRTVVHAAALAHVFDRRRTASALFTAVNEIGTANVVRAAVEGGASRIVLLSTVAAHAAIAADAGQGGPIGPYATSKWRAEQRAREITDAAGVPLIVLRLAIVYGEEDPGNIGRLMRAIDRGRFVWIGDGSNRKSLIYREDAARACLLAAGDGDTGCATYDVSASPHTMREIVSVLAEALGRRTPPIRLPAGIARPLADAATWLGGGRGRLGAVGAAVTKWLTDDVYDSCRFAAAFGFQPRVDLREGLRREVAWYRMAAGDASRGARASA